MQNRRHFFGCMALATPVLMRAAEPAIKPAPAIPQDRATWVSWLIRVAGPVLEALSTNQLVSTMPVESTPGNAEKRRPFTHLEAFGRTLAGIAPWLECGGLQGPEETQRRKFAGMAIKSLHNIVDPAAADQLSFTAGAQCLVDASFLALGLLRAPKTLWEPLDATTKQRLIAALQSTRKIKPGRNNWLLFSATIEAFFASIGEPWLPEPIETAFAAHEEWYLGDGTYGDGPQLHCDYYNSFVIHPMLLAVSDTIQRVDVRWEKLRAKFKARAVRYAALQEGCIAPDGTYPALGRSITYRCGAFHLLAKMALREELPQGLSPSQVRGALSAVMQRTLGADGTFDPRGWLQVGLAGHQPSLAETYISTGSLYLCCCVFLPLGLAPEKDFWSGTSAPWTSQQIWSGKDHPADHAM